jgi:molybdopterin-guanine dinucleotide biosynthesis protein A
MAAPDSRIPGTTGVILAGGRSSRMGSNKALLPYQGGRFIEAIFRQLNALFDDVILVTNTPRDYTFLPCRSVADLHPGAGALAGLHAGLFHSTTSHIFAVACDMPYLNEELIRALVARRDESDVIIPEGEGGLEPLHAVYAAACLSHMEASLLSGQRRIVSFFDRVAVQCLGRDQVATIDPAFSSFRNINTPEDYFELRQQKGGEQSPVYPARILSRH